MNLHSDFRVSLAEHILTFHTDPGLLDRATDVVVTALREFKAFTLFSLLFGAGMAASAERPTARGVDSTRFLARRLLVLFVFGLVHLLLVWNGDILTLYAVCGVVMLPLLRLSATALAMAGAAALALPYVVPLGFGVPTDETLRGLAAEAARVDTEGSFGDVVAFHWRESRLLIFPLLVGSLILAQRALHQRTD